jgi:hypothetical protein
MTFYMPQPGLFVQVFRPFISGTSNHKATDENGVIEQPSNTLVGDMMICLIGTSADNKDMSSAPSGWTQVFNRVENNDSWFGYSKVATVDGYLETTYALDAFSGGNDNSSYTVGIRGGAQKVIEPTGYVDTYNNSTNPSNPPNVEHGSYERAMVAVSILGTLNQDISSGDAPSNMNYGGVMFNNGSIDLGYAYTPNIGGNEDILFGTGFNANAWTTPTAGSGERALQFVVPVY